MPVYEYVCMGCEHRFEQRHAMAHGAPACPVCGRERARRQLSMFATSRTGRSSSSGEPTAGGCCGGSCGCAR